MQRWHHKARFRRAIQKSNRPRWIFLGTSPEGITITRDDGKPVEWSGPVKIFIAEPRK